MAPASQHDHEDVALAVESVTKTFGANRALSGVSMRVRRGEVHALAGGNGSGKSTLIKILAGVYRGDAGGTITVKGQRVAADDITPQWSRLHGMHFVHQDLGLFDQLSVAENIFAGSRYPGQRGRVRWALMRQQAEETLERLRVPVSPRRLAGDLRPAERTLVAIARALHGGAHAGHVLVLDEPTAPLPAAEVDALLDAVRRFAAAGEAIIYVSHRLDEVMQISDRVTVLRDGEVAARRITSEMDHAALVADIVGHRGGMTSTDAPAATVGLPVLEVSGLAGGPIKDVGFSVRRGEVLGIAGLAGSGRTTLLEMLFGARPRAAGSLCVAGTARDFRSPRDAIRGGIAYIPENRPRDAAFPDQGIQENLSAASLRRFGLWRFRHRAERADARADVARLGIRALSSTVPLQDLSGGNQQKVVLGRWLRVPSKVILLDEPTQGVDIGARSDIYRLVRSAVAAGAAVVVVSSDFEELATVSDRVLVLSGGRITAERAGGATREWITQQVFRPRPTGVHP